MTGAGPTTPMRGHNDQVGGHFLFQANDHVDGQSHTAHDFVLYRAGDVLSCELLQFHLGFGFQKRKRVGSHTAWRRRSYRKRHHMDEIESGTMLCSKLASQSECIERVFVE